MKYIEVLAYNEYSVFEVIEEYEKTIKCKLTNCENGYIIIGKNNVIAEADTIEELCDEFVYEYKNSFYKNSKPSYELVKMSLESMKATMEFFSGATFYGAIWTSKGLIYVAKMDNEGKLVLI